MVTGAILDLHPGHYRVRASNLMASFIVIPMALLIPGRKRHVVLGDDKGPSGWRSRGCQRAIAAGWHA